MCMCLCVRARTVCMHVCVNVLLDHITSSVPSQFFSLQKGGHFMRRQACRSKGPVSYRDQEANVTDDACLVFVMS